MPVGATAARFGGLMASSGRSRWRVVAALPPVLNRPEALDSRAARTVRAAVSSRGMTRRADRLGGWAVTQGSRSGVKRTVPSSRRIPHAPCPGATAASGPDASVSAAHPRTPAMDDPRARRRPVRGRPQSQINAGARRLRCAERGLDVRVVREPGLLVLRPIGGPVRRSVRQLGPPWPQKSRKSTFARAIHEANGLIRVGGGGPASLPSPCPPHPLYRPLTTGGPRVPLDACRCRCGQG